MPSGHSLFVRKSRYPTPHFHAALLAPLFRCLSIRLRFLELVDQFSIFHFHRAFRETSFCVHVPKDDDALLRIPCIKTVDVRIPLPAGDQFVADANGLTVLCPRKRGVNFFFFPSGESGNGHPIHVPSGMQSVPVSPRTAWTFARERTELRLPPRRSNATILRQIFSSVSSVAFSQLTPSRDCKKLTFVASRAADYSTSR